MKNSAFALGLEVLLQEPARIAGRQFGLLCNQASVDRDLRYSAALLAEAGGGRLRVLFAPQHGEWGELQANMIESPHTRHPRLGVPIYSLYSETRRPTAAMLDGLDTLVIDLQDVGTRIYTFIWTVSHCLEACADQGVSVLVLDRPNPLGGQLVEGPLLDPAYRSFVGRAEIPMRHGLTLGELSLLVNRELGIGAELEVVPMRGWTRDMSYAHCQRTWIPPSPNLPHLTSVDVYPGQVLLEGTNLSEGRGTTLPFEWTGAPYIDPWQFAEALEGYELPGVRFRPLRFVPCFDKWAGQSCGGIAFHVTDRRTFRPYRTSIAALAAVRRLWPEAFAWLPPPYEYETQKPPIDILSGSSRLRELFESQPPASADALEPLSACDEERWRERSESCRLYP